MQPPDGVSPEFEQPVTPPMGSDAVLDRNTVFRMLGTSAGIQELQAGQHTAISITRPAAPGTQLEMRPDGTIVQGFNEMFQPGFEGWKPGDVVRARYVVDYSTSEPDAAEAYLKVVVADSYTPDEGRATSFTLRDPEQIAQLRASGVAELDMDVQITSEAVSKGWVGYYDYAATVDTVNDVMQPWDGSSPLEPGLVLLEGEVIEYVTRPNDRDLRTPTYIVVRINDSNVTVNMDCGFVAYEGIRAEGAPQAQPTIGDRTQLLASYRPDYNPNPEFARPVVSPFNVAWCRTAYCLEPAADTLGEQDATSMQLAQSLNELEQADNPADFMTMYGQIIQLAYSPGEDGVVGSRLSSPQQAQLTAMTEHMFAASEPEAWPLLAKTGAHPMMLGRFAERYGASLYGMSVADAYRAGLDMVQDPSYVSVDATDGPQLVFDVLRGAASVEQMSDLARAALRAHYTATVRKQEAFNGKDLARLGTASIPSGRMELSERALSQLGSTGLPRDIETLVSLFESSAQNNQFPHRHGEIGYMPFMVRTLKNALRHTAELVDVGDEALVGNPAALAGFVGQTIPRLEAAVATYVTKADATGDRYAAIRARHAVDELAELITLASTLQRSTGNS